MKAHYLFFAMMGCAALLQGETTRPAHSAAASGKPATAVAVHAPARLPEATKLTAPAPAVPQRRRLGPAAGTKDAFPARSFRGARAASPSNVFLPSTPFSTGLPHRGPYAAVLGGSVSARTAPAGLLSGNRVKHKL